MAQWSSEGLETALTDKGWLVGSRPMDYAHISLMAKKLSQ